MDRQTHRQHKLQQLIDEVAGGRQSKLAEMVDIASTSISRMLYPKGKAGAKAITEKTTEKIERLLNLPIGWFDAEMVDAIQSPSASSTNITIDQLRRKNLRKLAEEVGGVGKLAELVNRDQSQISQWINGSIIAATGKPRGVRSSTLRDVEMAIGKPLNWLDQDHDTISDAPPEGYVYLEHYDVQSSAGHGTPVTYEPNVKRMLVAEKWVSDFLGRYVTDKIKLIDNKGVSMHPTINDGDVLLVDISCTYYDGDGIYIISDDGELKTKRLIKEEGVLRIVSDNPSNAYKERVISAKNQDTLIICGKVKKNLTVKDVY